MGAIAGRTSLSLPELSQECAHWTDQNIPLITAGQESEVYFKKFCFLQKMICCGLPSEINKKMGLFFAVGSFFILFFLIPPHVILGSRE